MDSFFTSEYPMDALLKTWSARKQELRRQTLKPFEDHLFNCLRARFLTRRAEMNAELVQVIRTATKRSDLTMPLWSYVAVRFSGYCPTYHAQLAYAQSIGLDDQLALPVTGCKERIHEVVRNSALLERLGAFFGPQFRVTLARKKCVADAGTQLWQAYEWELCLQFHPEPRAAQAPAPIAATPPPHAPLQTPPPLARPMPGGGVTAEELSEIQLNLEPTLGCHCCYSRSDEEE